VAKPQLSAADATASITARSAPAPIPSACNPSRIVQRPLSNFAKTAA
jgi:hypothetical protein